MSENVTGGTGTILRITIAFLPLLASCAGTGGLAVPSPESPVERDLPKLVAYLKRDLAAASVNDSRLPGDSGVRAMEDGRDAADALASMRIPVAGVWAEHLADNFGEPRDGGVRSHRGIDIFAPRGTKVIAAADGTITYLGEQRKGGLCLWLTTDAGVAFYYAHLDRWVSGLQEGMRVRQGALIGYVGNTGNAKKSPPHLHFQVVDGTKLLNPWPLLQQARGSFDAAPVLRGGFGR